MGRTGTERLHGNLPADHRGQHEAFFFEDLFRVHHRVLDSYNKPRITVNASFAVGVALRLAKAGLWGGDPEKILKAPAEMVMAALHYEVFTADYERAVYDLNRAK